MAKTLPRRGDRSVDDVLASFRAEIEELEYQLSSRSWSLTEEKNKMKEIVAVKQKMNQFLELNTMDATLVSLRDSIDQVRKKSAPSL